MNTFNYNLLLADDDEDDCAFFKEALDELLFSVTLVTVNDGEQLMKFLLNATSNLPDILFLDLNMPRKSGCECLTEIKRIDELKHLPVIIFSTSLNSDVVDSMYEKGAIHYIQKPAEFSKLKSIIENAIHTSAQNNFKQPVRNDFVLQP
jgi:DNA-binding NtrC family response regulator